MRKADITIGAPYAVQHTSGESNAGGQPRVKATALETGVERKTYGSPKRDGVRCRLEEPLRVNVGHGVDAGGAPFEELPVGTEFLIPAEKVLNPWGAEESESSYRTGDDAELQARAERYCEQDELRERLGALGLAEQVGYGDPRGYSLGRSSVGINSAALLDALRAKGMGDDA